MRRNQLAFIIFLLIAGAAVATQLIFKWSKGTLLNPTPVLNITVTYSSELSDWLQPATSAFNGQDRKVGEQRVHVDLEIADDGDAMRDILAGKRKPTAWIPASTIWVNLLNNQWRPNHQADLLLRSGEYAATSLVRTPMVFVMYAERAEAFQKGGLKVDWLDIQKAVSNPEGWKALGGSESWGQVKYSQPDPTTSNAGLLAVTLATYSYFSSTGVISSTTAPLDAKKLDDPAYRDWIGSLAGSLVNSAPRTARQQMDDFILLGTASYDVICIYESLVAQEIRSANIRFGTDLKVFYPSVNIWSDYPFSILVSEESSAEEKDAALLFRNYLYSQPVQQGALNVGFRPANPDVQLITGDPNNPFNKYKDAGLQINIPRTAIADAPTGEVVNRLMSVFQR